MKKTVERGTRRHRGCDPSWSDGGELALSCNEQVCASREQLSAHRRRRQLNSVQAIQSLRIEGLKSEVSEMRKLIDMLLVLVDPEDVQAALRIEKFELSHDELMEMADECVPPANLHGKE